MKSSEMTDRAIALLQQAEQGLSQNRSAPGTDPADVAARAAVAQGWALAAIATRTDNGVAVDISR